MSTVNDFGRESAFRDSGPEVRPREVSHAQETLHRMYRKRRSTFKFVQPRMRKEVHDRIEEQTFMINRLSSLVEENDDGSDDGSGGGRMPHTEVGYTGQI